MDTSDEHQIIKLFEDGDRALMGADIRQIERIYAEDYVQSNESGALSTRADLIRNLTSAAIRFFSMKSTGREVRILGDFAIVHGSEEDELEQDGQRSSLRYVYMDVVVKRSGRWQIVGSQLARPSNLNPSDSSAPPSTNG
jgi:ketosteroid isomerase-like protein